MNRTRLSVSLSFATAVVGVGTLAMPAANATPLDDQNHTITADRAKYGPHCPPLVFNPVLESMAQAPDAIGTIPKGGLFPKYGNAGTVDASRYNGEIRFFSGFGDPHAAALTAAYKAGAGAMLSNCDFTEFGTGFYRSDDAGSDYVGIIFGKPA